MSWRPRGPGANGKTAWTWPRDVWLVAGTPLNKPHPCRCVVRKRCRTRGQDACSCAGRLDLDAVPATCCAHYNTPEVVAG
jgi:hypothetical protein